MEFGIQFFPSVGPRQKPARRLHAAIEAYDAEVGGFEIASLQVNFGMIDRAEAEASMRLFAREVRRRFR